VREENRRRDPPGVLGSVLLGSPAGVEGASESRVRRDHGRDPDELFGPVPPRLGRDPSPGPCFYFGAGNRPPRQGPQTEFERVQDRAETSLDPPPLIYSGPPVAFSERHHQRLDQYW
jgi:hypothetical protein